MLQDKNFFDELDSNQGDAISDVYEQNDIVCTATITYKKPVELNVPIPIDSNNFSDKTVYVDKIFISLYDLRLEDIKTRQHNDSKFYISIHDLTINLFLNGEQINKDNNQLKDYSSDENSRYILYYFGMDYYDNIGKIYLNIKTPFVNFINNPCRSYYINDKNKGEIDTLKLNQPFKDLLLKTGSIDKRLINAI